MSIFVHVVDIIIIIFVLNFREEVDLGQVETVTGVGGSFDELQVARQFWEFQQVDVRKD